MDLHRFENQVVLITGAAGGMGQAIAKMFAEQGAVLALADVNKAALTQMVSSFEQSTTKVASFIGDLADQEYCDRLPSAVVEHFGRLDVVVNNAGLMRRGSITQASDEDYYLSFLINVEAPFRICRSAIKIMAARSGGRIVNVASCWGLYPGPDHLIYCTTKGALATMTKCLGRDHAADNIRVNAVCPNEVDTPMLRTGFEIRGLDPKVAIKTLDQSVPLGRIAQPQDIAKVVTFLASAESDYICGECIEVNGAKPVY